MQEKKTERRKINIFSKNDIYRLFGVIFFVAGQFMRQNVDIDKPGIKASTNLMTAFGFFIFALPFLFRYLQGKKQ